MARHKIKKKSVSYYLLFCSSFIKLLIYFFSLNSNFFNNRILISKWLGGVKTLAYFGQILILSLSRSIVTVKGNRGIPKTWKRLLLKSIILVYLLRKIRKVILSESIYRLQICYILIFFIICFVKIKNFIGLILAFLISILYQQLSSAIKK